MIYDGNSMEGESGLDTGGESGLDTGGSQVMKRQRGVRP